MVYVLYCINLHHYASKAEQAQLREVKVSTHRSTSLLKNELYGRPGRSRFYFSSIYLHQPATLNAALAALSVAFFWMHYESTNTNESLFDRKYSLNAWRIQAVKRSQPVPTSFLGTTPSRTMGSCSVRGRAGE
jgi:hypothetical protein